MSGLKSFGGGALSVTKSDIDNLSKKLDAVLFAQAEILLRLRQEGDESLQYPLYIQEALVADVELVQEDIDEALKLAHEHLAKKRQERR